MSAALRPAPISPVAEIAAATLLAPERQPAAAGRLALADVSLMPRYGCKGPSAAGWLEGLGLPVPVAPNRWLPLDGGGLIARLGIGEFLVDGHDGWVERLQASEPPRGAATVLRQDASLLLGGEGVQALLRQTCSVNFAALPLTDSPVVLTSMVGVAVTVLPWLADGMPRYRLWCDGTYGAYLWETLHDIAAELGGGAVEARWLA